MATRGVVSFPYMTIGNFENLFLKSLARFERYLAEIVFRWPFIQFVQIMMMYQNHGHQGHGQFSL